ncbi:hypothetical protein [Candidatus Cardinium hertigii]|uniref:hypothetical protein n=1 Tax=Candidatus Cardinium hertigii TaxID=247481 RepID=UPI000F4CADC0|nr:hypothetical protein [Candidatus Cardinium hertigii]
MNFTPEERTLYEGHLKWLWVEENTVKKAKNEGKEEGIQIGKEEGIQIGKEEGIQIGKEKGIQIGKEEGIQIGKEEGIQIGKEEGIQIGKEEGIQLGKEEGIQLGKEEGIQLGETQKAMAIAQNLLQEKLPIAYVAKVTGLTINQVEQLYNVFSQ